MNIRPLEMNDFPAWLPLWDSNNKGVRNQEITAELWSRLTDPDFAIHCLVAEEKGELCGMVQYVIHHVTGAINPVCYMQDVYVSEEHRKKGIARKMISKLSHEMAKEKWARMYWLAEADNVAAQKLYESVGVKLNFTLHVMMPK